MMSGRPESNNADSATIAATAVFLARLVRLWTSRSAEQCGRMLADARIARAHPLRVGDDSGAPARRSEVVDCCARRRLILALRASITSAGIHPASETGTIGS